MKKRLIALMMAAAMVFSVTACSPDKKADAGNAGVNPDDYVTIAKLEEVEVAVPTYTYTDADVESELQTEFEYYVDYADAYNYQEITDRTDVQTGDICNIDYEGLKDGVAFEGGTAQGHNLEIGSGSFIDGFEDGLIGHNVGEDVALNLTFPEDYGQPDLAGAAVVFNVKINSIQTKSMPEMTDEVVATFGQEFTTIEGMKESVAENLKTSCEEEKEYAKTEALWSALSEACEIKEPPQELVDKYAAEVKKNIEYYAQMYGVELEEFITSYMGMDQAAFDEEAKTSGIEGAKEELLVKAIAKKADISVTDDEVQTGAEAEFADYGYETKEAFLEDVGADNYKQFMLKEKVEEYLNGVVKFVDGEEINILESYYGGDEETSEETGAEDDAIELEVDEGSEDEALEIELEE